MNQTNSVNKNTFLNMNKTDQNNCIDLLVSGGKIIEAICLLGSGLIDRARR
jgi:hypothetical protein